MGCVTSKEPPVQKAPPEPEPNLEEFPTTKIEPYPGEPQLTSGQWNFTSSDNNKPLELCIKKTHKSRNGDSFKVKTLEDDKDWNNLFIEPALGLVPGQQIRSQLQDLVVIHPYGDKENLIAFAVKDIPQGVTVFKVLTSRPSFDKQPPCMFKGPNDMDLYNYAHVNFDAKTTVCGIKITGEDKNDRPLYTMRKCSKDKQKWIVLKDNIHCTYFEQVKGVLAGYSAYKLTICAGVDPIFMVMLANTTDEHINFYPG